MPAVTYSVSLSEESAASFEKTAAENGLEPSEALCTLVRAFVEAGGVPAQPGEGGGSAERDDAGIAGQVNDWKTLQEARARDKGQVHRVREAGGTQPDADGTVPGGASAERARLPWEDPDGEPEPPWHSPDGPSSRLSNLNAKDIDGTDFGVEEAAPSANSWLNMRLSQERP